MVGSTHGYHRNDDGSGQPGSTDGSDGSQRGVVTPSSAPAGTHDAFDVVGRLGLVVEEPNELVSEICQDDSSVTSTGSVRRPRKVVRARAVWLLTVPSEQPSASAV